MSSARLIALKALNADHAVLCSAYPQNKRTVEHGVLLVDGVPVAETEVGQDKLSPLPSSYVEMIIGSSVEQPFGATFITTRPSNKCSPVRSARTCRHYSRLQSEQWNIG